MVSCEAEWLQLVVRTDMTASQLHTKKLAISKKDIHFEEGMKDLCCSNYLTHHHSTHISIVFVFNPKRF